MTEPDPAEFLSQLIAGFSANSIDQLCRQIYEPAIIASIESLRAGREAHLEQAIAERDQAWCQYAEVAPRLSSLEGRLSEAMQFDSSAELDVEESTITEWRDASARQLSNERLKDELRQRIGLLKPMIDERVAANGKASAHAESAQYAVDQLNAAIADPFGHPLGRVTPGYAAYLLHTGQWRGHLSPEASETPTGKASRKLVLDALRASGLMDEIEAEAIARYNRHTELRERVNRVNAAPGNPFAGGSLERPGDRTGAGPMPVPGIPGLSGSGNDGTWHD